jgi:aryl-alcohol dehydrogenase-like predicted oxidoreductase
MKSQEEIRNERQTVWNTLSTPIYDEFLSSDQTLTSFNESLQHLKTTFADLKQIDLIISSFTTTKTYDDHKLNFLNGLKAAEKSCRIGKDENNGWIFMGDQSK